MRQNLLRAVGVAILALSLAFITMAGSATQAHAASSSGAQHFHASGCTLNIRTGILDCLTEDYVMNDTLTPSGNESVHAHGTTTDTESLGGTVISSATESFDYHFLRQDGRTHEQGSHMTIMLTENGTTCTEIIALHFANGRLQFDRFSSTC